MVIDLISRARLTFEKMTLGAIAIGVFVVLHAVLFLSGYRLTADDVFYHSVVMDGWASFWDFVRLTAINQGRIVHLFDVPVTLLAAYFAENFYFRIFYTSFHFFSLLLFSVYVARVLRLNIIGLLFILLVAVQPLDYFHLPPNAYPFHVSLPVVLLLLARLGFLRDSASPLSLRHKVFFLWLSIIGMMFGEGAFVFYAALLIFESIFSADFVGGWRGGRIILDLGRIFAWELCAIFVFLITYLMFRWTYPSTYDGNQLAENFDWLAIFRTLLGHIWGGTSFSSFRRYGLDMKVFLSNVEGPQLYLAALVGLVGTYASYRMLVNGLWGLGLHRSRAVGKVVLAGILGAVIVTLPVALVAKYQNWCSVSGVCIFHDSRLSYYFVSLVFLGGCLLIYCFKLSEFQRRLVAMFGALCIGGVSVATYLNNLRVSIDMSNYVQGWERARVVACLMLAENRIPLGLIDPQRRISMHATFDREAYWMRYLDSLRSGFSTESCVGDIYNFLPPIPGGKAVSVARDGAGVAYLGQGWSQPEPWGVWSAEERVSLFFPVKKPIDLVLKLRAFVRPNHLSQRILVKVDGVLLRELEVRDSLEFEVAIFLPHGTAKGRVAMVEMEFPDAVSPRTLGLGDDPRRLAVGLLEVSLR